MLLLASPACAWHDAGHRKTAEIAFDLLSESDQHRVVAILRAHPRFSEDFVERMPGDIAIATEDEKARWLFRQASIWPDLIQKLGDDIRRRYHHSTWHYINLPVFLTEQDERDFADRLDHNMSVDFVPPLRPGLNLIQALKGNLLVWRDESVTDEDKALALCWILHLASDMHQPLHNVALFASEYFPEGDRGGNLIAIRHKDDTTNLHAIWDGVANHLDGISPDETTSRILANEVVTIDSVADWSRDGQATASVYAYSDEVRSKILDQPPSRSDPQITLSAQYLATAEKIATPRVVLAGHRIAALIAD